MSRADGPIVVATHGHCFDGMASATLFAHLVGALDPTLGKSDFVYRGQSYDAGKNGVDPSTFAGAREGAILDYRFTDVPGLTWYFDHHASAFPGERERDAFAVLAGRGRGFFDAHRGSCTMLVADVARERFGVDLGRFADLMKWADIIDRAAFPSAAMAVERAEPELQLMSVVEQLGDDRLLADLVGRLSARPLHEVAADADLAEKYAPIGAAHRRIVERIRAHEERRGAVVWVDLLDAPIETVAKFVTYADVPDAPYSVVASRSEKRCKLSIGYNPWCPTPRAHDISKLCERYGGGGHAVVGAVSLPLDVEAARNVALEIVEALNR
jgi:hypothetical protein